MHSSDTVKRRAEGHAGAGPSPGTQRPTSRIIASERLHGCVPFTMHELERDPGAPRNVGSAAPAQHESNSPFGRFDDGFGPIDQEGYEAGYRAGRDAGFADGMKRGFEAGVQHAAAERRRAEEAAGITLAVRVEALSSALQASFAQVEREAADEVVRLALDVARQVVRASLAHDRSSILAVVQEALASLVDDSVRVHLHLNPSDADLVRSELGERLGARMCEIVPDTDVQPGGCLIETPRASVDATLETRWRRVLAAIGRADDFSIPAGRDSDG